MKVKTIIGVIPKAYMDMDKTTFTTDDGKTAYTFAKIAEGGEYDGEMVTDKGGNLQFKKKKDWPQGGSGGGNFTPKSKEFKADPLKQASIERQVALKCAIDLLAAKLPQMKDQPKSGELAKAAIEIANVFDDFLKVETLDKEKAEVAELLTASEEIPFTDGEIDLEEIEIK